jgi:hypothetical protein
MRTTYRLTAEAAAKQAKLAALLDELGLSIDEAHALMLAEGFAEELNEAQDDEALDDAESFVQGFLDDWAEDGHEAWRDVLCHLPATLTTETA